jgi:chromosome partitioning protein
LALPDHYPVKERDAYGTARNLKQFIAQLRKDGRAHKGDFVDSSSLSHSADLRQFISQLSEIGRADKHDFVVIDTPSGVQHLSLIAHGMADTLITPINDSFFDLDVLVAMESSDLEPQLSAYANMVWRALEARSKVSGRATDWVIVRNRLEAVESNNQRQITLVLDVLQKKLGFRIGRGLLERPAYREFFAAGLTVFDFAEGPEISAESGQANSLARAEVENLIREIGLMEDHAEPQNESLDEIEPAHD